MSLWKQEHFEVVCEIVNSLIDKTKMTTFAMRSNSLEHWTKFCQEFIQTQVECQNQEIEYAIIQCLLSSKAKEDSNFEAFYFNWVDKIKNDGGRVV